MVAEYIVSTSLATVDALRWRLPRRVATRNVAKRANATELKDHRRLESSNFLGYRYGYLLALSQTKAAWIDRIISGSLLSGRLYR